jgi:Na+-transporting NADH:ubiquinone oxidoreductase subunit NqrC
MNPSLTEPGMKYFINETLKQCHVFKENYNNYWMNISLAILFFSVIAIILFIKYKKKLTPKEKKAKEREKQHYILSKIKNYQDAKQKMSESLITGLPRWNDES